MSNGLKDYADIWAARPRKTEMEDFTLISEIGLNAVRSIPQTFKLIDAAVMAQQYTPNIVVKFQKRTPRVCTPRDAWDKMRKVPWVDHEVKYIDYREMIEYSKEEYDQIDSYCKEKGIRWTASPWDVESLIFLLQYDIPFIKIPSAHLTNRELLIESVKSGVPIVLSIGMSTEAEVCQSLLTMKHAGLDIEKDLTLLHTNSAYPARPEDLNLSVIPRLKREYTCRIGYSNHAVGIDYCLYAACLGANVIEAHTCLDKRQYGGDQKCSLEPHEFLELSKRLQDIRDAYGRPDIEVTESELGPRAKLRGY